MTADVIYTWFNVYWSAAFKNDCGCGECKAPVGHGHTEQEAIDDLQEQAAARLTC